MGNRRHAVAVLFVLAAASLSCRTTSGLATPGALIAEGQGSYYGKGFHGRPTANGERFDKEAMTAAHPKLPFGTCVRVESVLTGKSVQVRINDRGPFAGGRIIDLSEAAARQLGMLDVGVAKLRLYRC